MLEATVTDALFVKDVENRRQFREGKAGWRQPKVQDGLHPIRRDGDERMDAELNGFGSTFVVRGEHGIAADLGNKCFILVIGGYIFSRSECMRSSRRAGQLSAEYGCACFGLGWWRGPGQSGTFSYKRGKGAVGWRAIVVGANRCDLLNIGGKARLYAPLVDDRGGSLGQHDWLAESLAKINPGLRSLDCRFFSSVDDTELVKQGGQIRALRDRDIVIAGRCGLECGAKVIGGDVQEICVVVHVPSGDWQ